MAMDIGALKDELTGDPLVRGYSGMTDAEVAVDLNTTYRQLNRQSMTGSEVLQAVDDAEYAALTDAKKQALWGLLGIGDLNPFGVEADVMVVIFGAGSDTITALQTARKRDVTRAEELGLGVVKPGHVEEARR